MAEKPSSISNTRASTDLGGLIHRGRTHPSRIGLNPAVTKAAVDLQNLSRETMDETVSAALDSLRHWLADADVELVGHDLKEVVRLVAPVTVRQAVQRRQHATIPAATANASRRNAVF